MAEPGTDGIDVNAGAKEMSGGRVSNGMWAHGFCRQRRHFGRYSFGIEFHHRVNAKPGQRSATSIHEDVFGWSSPNDQVTKLLRRVRPQWTQAQLIALTADLH